MSSSEQQELFPPLPEFLVGIRTKSGEIQHYKIEAVNVTHALQLAKEGLCETEDPPRVLLALTKSDKKQEAKKPQQYTHTPSPSRA